MVWFTITTLVKPLNPWSKSGLYHQKRSETPKNITKYGITINLVDIRLRKNSFNLHNPLLIRIRDALESFRRMRYLINGFWFTINITKNKKIKHKWRYRICSTYNARWYNSGRSGRSVGVFQNSTDVHEWIH